MKKAEHLDALPLVFRVGGYWLWGTVTVALAVEKLPPLSVAL
jgi:hypothetical protein